MRILICDDDNLIIEQLEKYIIEFFKKKKLKSPDIQSFDNGQDLLSDDGAMDIVFLDIEMPGLNGIYIGTKIKKNLQIPLFL